MEERRKVRGVEVEVAGCVGSLVLETVLLFLYSLLKGLSCKADPKKVFPF